MHYDVIIIGTGAGGGTMAHALASTGKKILMLERGSFLPKERENWDTQEIFTKRRYQARESWHYSKNDKTERFDPMIHYWVGGNTKMYGAALFRLREKDFQEVKHYEGISPAWPIDYRDLAPYYSKAESLYCVHGERNTDPTEPPSQEPYPFAPLAHEPRVKQLKEDLERLGYKPFPLPMGVSLPQDTSNSVAPVSLSLFDGYPDPTESKADAYVSTVKPALEHSNVEILTNHLVDKFETDPSGNVVTAVHTWHADELKRYTADIVVLAAGAANSAAIMLRSYSDKHSNGLANSSGLVGRNYMSHNNATFIAISKEPNESKFQKTLTLSDFYFGTDDWPYPMGLIQMLGKVDAELMHFESPEPLGGMSYEEMAKHSVDFWLQSEDLPSLDNRVTLNKQGEMVLHYQQNNLEAHKRLTEKLRSLLGYIGCHEHMIPMDYYLGTKSPFNLAHQCGTMRFGTDTKTSVLDVHCKAHELDNLYVADASFFVSAGAVNPSLTIIANSLRVAEHIAERLN